METTLPPARASVQAASVKTRLDFVDNLRWTMIVLVVSMHAAVTYSHLGSWYFMIKFGCATALGVAATYLASGFLLRRVPLLRRIL